MKKNCGIILVAVTSLLAIVSIPLTFRLTIEAFSSSIKVLYGEESNLGEDASYWNSINVTGEDKYDFDVLGCHKLVWEPGYTNNPQKNTAIAIAVMKMDMSYALEVEKQLRQIRRMSDKDICIIIYEKGTTYDIIEILVELTKHIQGIQLFIKDLGFQRTQVASHFARYQGLNRNCCGISEYVKLEAWKLPYDQVLFLDIDATLVKSPDVLFECDADVMYSAGPFSPFNAGMFVLKPNKKVYEHMIKTLKRVSHTYTDELCFEGLGCGPCKKLEHQLQRCVGREGPQGFLHYYFVKRKNARKLTVRQISSCVFDYQNDRHHICPKEFPRMAHTYPYIVHKDEGLIDYFNEEQMILTAPSEKVCRPDFWILGTRKGGTTRLYTSLVEHPLVAPLHVTGSPQDGEVFVSIQTLKKYNQEFRPAPPQFLVGDSTTGRIVKDARNLIETCGHKYTKLLILLRDPVERCHSQMLMRARLETDGMNQQSNISEYIRIELNQFHKAAPTTKWARSMYPTDVLERRNCINAGIYVAQLKRWLYHASISNIRIYFSEDFQNNEEEIVLDALQFIGIHELDNFTLNLSQQNANARPKHKLPPHQQITSTLRREMEKTFHKYNHMLQELLQVELPWTY